MTDRPTVDVSTYTAEYYLTACDGYEAFTTGDLPARLRLVVRHANLRPGLRLLDLACGRGEMVRYAAEAGLTATGIDYAGEAVRLAAPHVRPTSAAGRVMHADGRGLPFADESFDRILLIDAVEHMYPWELHRCLTEAGRVLAPGGRLIIHTMPNLWYYRYGYPLFRVVSGLAGKPQPADPRDRFPSLHEMHINEQTPRALARSIHRAGLAGRVWLESWQTYDEDSPAMRAGKTLLARAPGLKLIFCDDILAIAERP